MSDERKWWYSLIAASPNPESGERLNVAILFGNGRPARLEFDAGLARLGCFAGRFEVDMYRHVLRSVSASLGRFASLNEVAQVIGPQLVAGEPRFLRHKPDRAIVKQLVSTYLEGPHRPRAHRDRHARVAQLDLTLKQLFATQPMFGLSVQKKADPTSLYQDKARVIFKRPVPAVDRALRSPNRDLLIGGVVVVPGNPASVKDPGVRLGRAFWHYREARDRIRDVTGIEVRTIGIIYNGAQNIQAQTLDALDYIEHVWRVDADEVLHAHRDSPSAAFLQAQVDWLTAHK